MPGQRDLAIGTITEGGLVTQVGEGREADEVAPVGTALGAPTAGEVLAERYELSAHINDDSAGRQVWRGIDVILRRPVAVVLRYPGGDSAVEMLQAAVTASRVIHPNLVGVYDAIDEQDRAYVVREWVDGRSLRELVDHDGLLDPARATSVAHAIAGAVAAVHATGMVHGNIHPGTIMIADDGRVVLADARADANDSRATDVRAIGGILYYALTGHWPHAEATLTGGTAGRGRASLPDAVRDSGGSLVAPRQARAGVPAYLDDLTMDLLDPAVEPPSSDVLAAELGRLDVADDPYLDDSGPLRFAGRDDDGTTSSPGGRRKIAAGVAGLLVVALVGLVFGINALAGGGTDGGGGGTGPVTQPGAGASENPSAEPADKPKPIPLSGDQVRVIDPQGDRTELRDVEKAVDGDPNEGWQTQGYKGRSNFGNLKDGMGILIDLKEPRTLSSVQVLLSSPGATAELRTGSSAPTESSKSADQQVVAQFSTRIGEPLEKFDGSTMSFSAFDPDQKYRYLLFWITDLPRADDGRYRIGVQEITVNGL
ncbi:protein kinase family protein [Plantactinospora sp. KBS50]|uniref:protein kinase family protein n=1 Tax=Plantactinospora sp. KBS50 TaxID=2024580 RepID=UPI000BAAEF85|nr:protein kinase family protein [Plantactinospora sp. KBS50]ASW57297.1 serine/threonine protein kinase [Plantactinospora sp. KBS50]